MSIDKLKKTKVKSATFVNMLLLYDLFFNTMWIK